MSKFKVTKQQRLNMEDAVKRSGYKRGSHEIAAFAEQEGLPLQKVISWVDRNLRRLKATDDESFEMHVTWNEFMIANKGRRVKSIEWKELNRQITKGILPSDAIKLTYEIRTWANAYEERQRQRLLRDFADTIQTWTYTDDALRKMQPSALQTAIRSTLLSSYRELEPDDTSAGALDALELQARVQCHPLSATVQRAIELACEACEDT